LSTALQAVDTILLTEPNHPEALALKESVNQAIEHIGDEPPPTTSVPVKVPPPGPTGPSDSERAAALAADASIAIGAEDFGHAEQLIRQGRQLDPTSINSSGARAMSLNKRRSTRNGKLGLTAM
jgi:hypothetical protein